MVLLPYFPRLTPRKEPPQGSPLRITLKDLPQGSPTHWPAPAPQISWSSPGQSPLIGASQTHRPGGRFTNRLRMLDLQDTHGIARGQPINSLFQTIGMKICSNLSPICSIGPLWPSLSVGLDAFAPHIGLETIQITGACSSIMQPACSLLRCRHWCKGKQSNGEGQDIR